MLPFEFVVTGPPVSQQTRWRKRLPEWRQKVREAAELHWPVNDAPHSERVMITITYFYVSVSVDVDNIAKPILDALKNLVYWDDKQATDIIVRKRDLSANLRVENPSTTLASGFGFGQDFLHIVVREAPDQEAIT